MGRMSQKEMSRCPRTALAGLVCAARERHRLTQGRVSRRLVAGLCPIPWAYPK